MAINALINNSTPWASKNKLTKAQANGVQGSESEVESQDLTQLLAQMLDGDKEQQLEGGDFGQLLKQMGKGQSQTQENKNISLQNSDPEQLQKVGAEGKLNTLELINNKRSAFFPQSKEAKQQNFKLSLSSDNKSNPTTPAKAQIGQNIDMVSLGEIQNKESHSKALDSAQSKENQSSRLFLGSSKNKEVNQGLLNREAMTKLSSDESSLKFSSHETLSEQLSGDTELVKKSGDLNNNKNIRNFLNHNPQDQIISKNNPESLNLAQDDFQYQFKAPQNQVKSLYKNAQSDKEDKIIKLKDISAKGENLESINHLGKDSSLNTTLPIAAGGVSISRLHDLEASAIASKNKSDPVLQLHDINSADPKVLINKIVEHIEVNRLQNSDSLDLTVGHNELGEFKIHVQKNADSKLNHDPFINMRITTSTEEGHNFFASNEKLLLSGLNQAGVKVADFRLVSSTGSLDFSNQSSSQFSDSNSKNQFGQQFSQSSGHRQFQSNQGQQQHDSQRRKDLWDSYRERMVA